MKKLFFIILSLVICCSSACYAQTKDQQKIIEKNEKAARKLAKKMAKQLKDGNWETTGAVDLETTLTNYYLQTEPLCGGTKRGVEHTRNDVKKLDVAEKRLLLQAQTMYAQEVHTAMAQSIKGQDPMIDEDDLAQLVAEIAARTEKEFNGDVQRSFIIYKTQPDGSMTVRAFYVIDQENGLARARKLTDNVKLSNN